mmetsp:Transcript_103175/g.274304  ORF Transcript_103175/g.274304 Transcript_103175/m.274304 type:complete len:268 (+) Transcript_103175:73-876(+)
MEDAPGNVGALPQRTPAAGAAPARDEDDGLVDQEYVLGHVLLHVCDRPVGQQEVPIDHHRPVTAALLRPTRQLPRNEETLPKASDQLGGLARHDHQVLVTANLVRHPEIHLPAYDAGRGLRVRGNSRLCRALAAEGVVEGCGNLGLHCVDAGEWVATASMRGKLRHQDRQLALVLVREEQVCLRAQVRQVSPPHAADGAKSSKHLVPAAAKGTASFDEAVHEASKVVERVAGQPVRVRDRGRVLCRRHRHQPRRVELGVGSILTASA